MKHIRTDLISFFEDPIVFENGLNALLSCRIRDHFTIIDIKFTTTIKNSKTCFSALVISSIEDME